MSLQSILNEIKKQKPFAEEELLEEPANTYSARKGRQNQAKEAVARLKQEYKNFMFSNSMFIITTGDKLEEFAKTAKKDFGLFVANSNDFYEDLVNRIPESIYLNGQGVGNAFDVLGRHLEDKMNELDIMEYNQIVHKNSYSMDLKSKQDLVNVVKTAVNEQVGSEVVGIQAINSIFEDAIERNHQDNITPIVLLVNNENEAKELKTTLSKVSAKVFSLSIGNTNSEYSLPAEFDKKDIKNVLTNIRKEIKK